MHRRELLKLVAASGGGGIAGCSYVDPSPPPTETATTADPDSVDPPTDTTGEVSTDTASPEATDTPETGPDYSPGEQAAIDRWGDRFDEFVNLADADVALDAPIDDALEESIADDTMVFLPDGSYELGSIEVVDVTNAAVVSPPELRPTIAPAAPADEINHLFMRFLGVSDLLVDGFDLDFRDEGVGGTTQVAADGDFVLRNVRVRGKMPDRSIPDNPAAFRFDVRDESASGLVQNVVATAGGHDGGNAIGMYVGRGHAGELTIEDCEIENFPNNGLYASSPGAEMDNFRGEDGVVHVQGGRYSNNNIANVRLGSTGATATDVTIVIDDVPPHRNLNARGLRLRGKSDQVVENCRIVVGEGAGTGFGALVIHPSNGRATIRDTEIEIDRDGIHAINALPAEATDESTGPVLENVSITGSAGHGRAVAIKDRDGTEIRNCSVVQSGTNRDGLLFVDSSDCLVAETEISVTAEPIRTFNSSIDRRNLTLEGRDDA